MLFNSYIFIFVFLPTTLMVYFFTARFRGGEVAIDFLVMASLFFYGWWNPVYLIVLIFSVAVNYSLGQTVSKQIKKENRIIAKNLLILGVAFNLGLLGYFKYANFFVDNIDALLGTDFRLDEIILPLAISFFTFQQIAYLVDAYKRETEELKFAHYVLFVTFFPQLIAGPIVHHKEMMPQFVQENMRPQLENAIIGFLLFSLGLFKKVVFADGIAQYSTPVFNAAANGETISFFVAWGGALAYTFQLYFDFSGYSDMAIGIARMFGIRLPLNFASPYKSLNIIEFWRRWHITLSRFLRNYVYIALGGNRKGKVRRYTNLLTTMLLGGLWHGAGWNFVIWGSLHGFYLVINHCWHYIKKKLMMCWLDGNSVWRLLAWLVTFVSVVNAWVFFRAENLDASLAMLKGMYGVNGIMLPNAIYARLGSVTSILDSLGITSYAGGGSQFVLTYLWISVLLLVVVMLPNTQQIMRYFTDSGASDESYVIFNQGVASKTLTFRFSAAWAFLMAMVSVLALFGLTQVSEFLYFQF